MKIIRNAPGLIKLCVTLRHLAPYKREIKDARAKGDYERERANIVKATELWGNNVLKICNAELSVYGKEHLPQKGPVVYMGNHQGYADIILSFAALNSIQFGFVAKQELEKTPFYGPWMKLVRSVFIRREDPRASLKAIDEGIELIKQGFSLMIFPEGTRSRSGTMGEFKRGAFKLATKPEVPIIPVSLNGSYRIFEETGTFQSAKLQVKIHPAIKTKGLSNAEQKELTGIVEKIIRDGVEKLQAEEQAI